MTPDFSHSLGQEWTYADNTGKWGPKIRDSLPGSSMHVKAITSAEAEVMR